MKKQAPTNTQRAESPGASRTPQTTDRTWGTEGDYASDFHIGADAATAIREMDAPEHDSQDSIDSFADNPFVQTGFGPYSQALNAEPEPFQTPDGQDGVEAHITDGDVPNGSDSFSLANKEDASTGETVIAWSASAFPEEEDPQSDSTPLHRLPPPPRPPQEPFGGERDVVALSTSAEAGHSGFAPQAFSYPEEEETNERATDENRDNVSTEPNGDFINDEDLRDTTVSRSTINLNAPLYPLDQDDPSLSLPQSLEEASARLGNWMGSSGSDNGPEITLSEPEPQDQDRDAFARNSEADWAAEPDGAELADHQKPELEIADAAHDGDAHTPAMVFALTPYLGPQDAPNEHPGPDLASERDADEQENHESPSHESNSFRVVIESRNTRTREVLLTEEEFNLAERQILEDRKVHISGKALVLDAIAITKVLPKESRRRRRHSAA
jgi:hypothetical protein